LKEEVLTKINKNKGHRTTKRGVAKLMTGSRGR